MRMFCALTLVVCLASCKGGADAWEEHFNAALAAYRDAAQHVSDPEAVFSPREDRLEQALNALDAQPAPSENDNARLARQTRVLGLRGCQDDLGHYRRLGTREILERIHNCERSGDPES